MFEEQGKRLAWQSENGRVEAGDLGRRQIGLLDRQRHEIQAVDRQDLQLAQPRAEKVGHDDRPLRPRGAGLFQSHPRQCGRILNIQAEFLFRRRGESLRSMVVVLAGYPSARTSRPERSGAA